MVAEQPRGIFGVPLNVSIKYANVAISLTNDNGESFIYGYVPIVVAKCGVYLKEKGEHTRFFVASSPQRSDISIPATDVEGIFRLNGSAKRIKDLQEIFDSPERYGKGLDWTGYTVHDAANILRRYLNQLPEPIVPLEFYERFREPLRNHQAQAVGDTDAAEHDTGDFDHDKAVATYQQLIRELPPLNKQLLLYILDLLAVFASKSEQNRMTSANLSAIFQPGLLSHPSHDMAPQEYKLSQDVLIFLIENQDHFLFGMNGTAADEQTVKDVESGVIVPKPSHSTVRRSVSSASGGTESLRKYETLRRNVSVSSKNSRTSNNPSNPATPTSLGGGMHRSNTVPSKKSPALPSSRLGRGAEPSTPTPAGLTPPVQSYQASRSSSRAPSPNPSAKQGTASGEGSVATTPTSAYVHTSTHGPIPVTVADKVIPAEKPRLQGGLPTGMSTPPKAVTPTKERKISSLFTKSPPPAGDQKEPRQPNRLKKKRIPGSASESAQSSSHSLPSTSAEPSTIGSIAQSLTQSLNHQTDNHENAASNTKLPTVSASSHDETVQQAQRETKLQEPAPLDEPHNYQQHQHQPSDHTLKPRSRTPSMNSRSSFTDHSDFDQLDEASKTEKKDNRRSRLFHRSKRNSDQVGQGFGSPPQLGVNSGAGFSTSSVGSSNRPRQGSAVDSQPFGSESSHPVRAGSDMSGSFDNLKDPSQTSEPEKRSFFDKFKAKVSLVKDGVKDWDAERERAKSPPQSDTEKSVSTQNSFYGNKENRSSKHIITEDPRESPEVSQQSPVSSALPMSGPPPVIPEEPGSPEIPKRSLQQERPQADAVPPGETKANEEVSTAQITERNGDQKNATAAPQEVAPAS
ncbi:Rho GTPase activator [Paecilomyces variotii No. 5]|uniref:Rho GTPase activator n=1 Tax=Byssochlamys spectabilis (strain No. 5 / NBRC 109023) TaxID=1356009 RepID=V5GGV8_BYSSN|nr:Rho GTPase activator [Paecilomyces variotii No. 5]